MTWLMAAWCAERLNRQDKAAEFRAKAEAAPTDLVFPSRLEELAAAEHAMKAGTGPRAAYYAGLVLMRLMRYDDAIARWQQAIDTKDDNALVRRCLAVTLAQVKQNRQDAIGQLERAIAIDPHQPGLYLDLADMDSRAGHQADARDVLVQAMQKVPPTDALVTALAAAHLAVGEYRLAAKAFADHRFNVAEGRYGAHDDYAIAWVGVALQALARNAPLEALGALDEALEYPENLSIGRTDDPQDEAMIHFWRGVVLQKLGESERARQAFERSVKEASGDRALRHGFYGAVNVAHGALALQVLGKTKESAAQIDRLKNTQSSRRRWEQPEMFKAYLAFRGAWTEALQGGDPPSAAAFKAVAEDPKVPAQWTRLSILATEVLQRRAPSVAMTQPAGGE
jgi:tetratricopeptide (TPR) repeat protein